MTLQLTDSGTVEQRYPNQVGTTRNESIEFTTTLTVNKVHEEAVRVINCTQGVEGGSYIKDHVKCWHSPPGIYIGLYDAHLIPLNAQPSLGERTAAAAPLPCCRPERPRD